jgi:L-rhamnose-H+ transport protein
MTNSTLLGSLLVALGGLSMGSSPWTLKVLHKLQFEHWLFVGMCTGLIVVPWGVTLGFCPNALHALRTVEPSVIIKSNIFAFGWGIANVLCCIGFVRIGVVLTGGILGGLGLSLGVMTPMVFKASGLFRQAPDLLSRPGKIVLAGVATMLVGVVLVSVAGFGRNRALIQSQKTSQGFLGGLVMVVIAGILSTGPNFAFAYSQDPIIKAVKAQGAGDIASTFAVWAVGMLSGAMINILFPAYLMSKNKSWHVLRDSWREATIPVIGGIQFVLAIVLLGNGNLMLGALGASVGWGIYQAMQILGGQAVGFASGEWKGIFGTPRQQMYVAIIIFLLATVVMGYGNSLVRVSS